MSGQHAVANAAAYGFASNRMASAESTLTRLLHEANAAHEHVEQMVARHQYSPLPASSIAASRQGESCQGESGSSLPQKLRELQQTLERQHRLPTPSAPPPELAHYASPEARAQSALSSVLARRRAPVRPGHGESSAHRHGYSNPLNKGAALFDGGPVGSLSAARAPPEAPHSQPLAPLPSRALRHARAPAGRRAARSRGLRVPASALSALSSR